MPLTPLDITHKEFKRTFRGVREREVQDFLREVANSLEEALTSNAELREKVQTLERRLLHYEKIEETMQNALVLAQKSAEETRLGSQKQAEVILADAELKRKQILDEARERGAEIEREYADLKQQRRLFEMEFGALLQAHQDTLRQRAEGRPVETPRLFTGTDEELPDDEPETEAGVDDPEPLTVLDWTRVAPDEGGRPEDDDDDEFSREPVSVTHAFGGV